MKQMGSEIQILFIFLPAVFLLNAHFSMAEDSSSMNAAQILHDLEMYRVEYNVDGKENLIQKVSGEDETEAERVFVLEKFRILLGLKNLNIVSSRNGHLEHGFLSPAPAPGFEAAAAAEVPAPVPVPHHHLHSHHRLPPRVNQTSVHRELRREHGNKDRVRGIIIAVVVSSGVALVISALGILLFCWKFRKGRRRSARTMSVAGATDGFRGRSHYVNSPNSINKVSLELGLYLNSLGSVSEPVSSCLKHTSETVNKQSNQTEKNSSSLDLGSESDKDSMISIHCSLAEEIFSVHAIGEPPIKCEPNEMVPIEILSSDDESFHSLCNSHSSIVRGSNASEGDMSDRSEILSPLNNPERISTHDHDHSSIPPRASFTRKSSNRSVTRKRTPPLHLNLNSSPLNTASNPRQTTPTSLVSSNTSQHFPPPPPPPPPPSLNFASSQSPFSSNRNASKQLLPSTKTDLSSPRNSYSSSGSNQVSSSSDSSSAHPKPQQASTSPINLRNIPPPPLLPPPFVKGCKNSPPPPPPPGQLPQLPPVGKDGAPLPKLKPLHWDKVRATPDRSMVWDKLKCSSFEFDEKMIESLFGYNLQKAMKNDETKSKSPSPSKHILEAKRLQNITILLKALNATAEHVCDALFQGDGLCLQQLEALVKMFPTKEEESLLLKFHGNINELSDAEKFVRAMLNIPFAFLRVEGMLFRETFEDEVVHLRKSFAMLEEACKELKSSQLFLKLLEAVLKTGNRMNVGTIRGGAKAFKLDALLKLADVKGTDGKTTLLHFVVQEMIRSEGITESDTIIIKKSNKKSKNNTVEEREEDYRRMGLDHVSSLSTELCNVKKTATIDLDVLASSVSNLSEGMVKLQHLVHEALSIDEQKGKFSQSMKSFLSYAEKNIQELKKDEDRVLLHVTQVTEYFHGYVSKEEANPLRIFVIVRDFLGMLDQVCKEIRSLKMPKIPNPLAPFQRLPM